MARSANMVRDKKTGKLRKKDMARSRAAKKGAKKRVGRKRSAATVNKIRKALLRVGKTGRTSSGRRAIAA